MKKISFSKIFEFCYAILFQVPAVQKWGLGTFGNYVKSGAHFFLRSFFLISKILIFQDFRWNVLIFMGILTQNRKLSKNIVSKRCFLGLPWPKYWQGCLLWCFTTKIWNTKFSWFFTFFHVFLDTFWWFFMKILTEFHGFLKIFRFSSNFGRLDLHDYWIDFKKFWHF